MMGNSFSSPIIVDLADIQYKSNLDPLDAFKDRNLGVTTFESNNPAYSYLKLDSSGHFIEAAEKVISRNASAGTYLFCDTATYLRALAYSIENKEKETYQDLFYVCPLLNGVKNQGKKVQLESVSNIVDVKNP